MIIHLYRHPDNNLGDNLSEYLTRKISGGDVRCVNSAINGERVYAVIGSILEWVPQGSIIWGVGYQREQPTAAAKPLTILAVRGKLTRDLLIKQGFECPEVYGDPALLLPRYYIPTPQGKYRLGIVPHYVDWALPQLDKYRSDPSVLMINVREPVEKVVDGICSCEQIISSSLHGLIVADAYGIPTKWEVWSDKVVGNGFKFRDYFSVRNEVDTNVLLNSCPFRGIA